MEPSGVQSSALSVPLNHSYASFRSRSSQLRQVGIAASVGCLCAVFVLAFASGHTSKSRLPLAMLSSSPSERPVSQMVIDTDMDYDDVIGLLFAARSPSVELLLVTICNTGFAKPVWATDLARAVLRSVGASSVLVANGTAVPFAAVATFPEAWDAQSIGYLGQLFGVSSAAAPAAPSAKEALLAALDGAKGLVDYVALGSHTNLADALMDPAARTLMRQTIRRVVLSGGAFRHAGNVVSSTLDLKQEFSAHGGWKSGDAECNVFLDAEATEIVCREASKLGIEVVFMPLDATEDLVITDPQINGYADAPPTSALGLLQGTLRGFKAVMPAGLQPRYWDPSAVVLALDGAVCEAWLPVQQLHVETRVGPDFSYGRLAWEPLNVSFPARMRTSACVQANYSRLLDDFWTPFGVRPHV